jgi:hypothetical protein
MGAGSSFTLYFAESEDHLGFTRDDSSLSISGSYFPGSVRVNHQEFRSKLGEFVKNRIAWLGREFPEIMENPEMGAIVASIEDSLKDSDTSI